MKKLFLLVGLALLGVVAWFIWETRTKPQDETPDRLPVAASRYSPAFVASMDSTLEDYYVLSESLVRWDSAHVPENIQALQASQRDLALDELRDDSVVYAAASRYADTLQTGLQAVAKGASLEEKRRAFHGYSQSFYDMLQAIEYDGSQVYLQLCPMAFNDVDTGVWLSKTAPIRNPYLGLYHPRYKSGMLACGETADSLLAAGR